MHLVLIGLRASGKTTLGRRLAPILGRCFIDLDDRTARVLRSAGAGAALRRRGEPAFRAAERVALRYLLRAPARAPALVIALGGGTPTHAPSHCLIEAARRAGLARIVYLRASPATLRERLARDPGDRPGLVGEDPLAEIESLHRERDALYAAMADATLDTDSRSPDEALGALVRAARSLLVGMEGILAGDSE